ncbi:MAG: aspartate/glutamate racemase family protein [bacterium]|nr:aspartate/glutamate racemase family protein [bacterium]
MEKMLGILGGMGPLATADLFKKIITMTKTDSDQDHIHIIIDSNCTIPDRTEFIKTGINSPFNQMLNSAKRLEANKVDCIIMPCHTAHYFYEEIKSQINIPFINMLKATAEYISIHYKENKYIGLLATEGIYISGIYREIFNKFNIKIIEPDILYRKYITNAIYSMKKGYLTDSKGIYKTINHLKELGAEHFILGCTELPIIFNKLNINENCLDPTAILAQSAIKFFNKKINHTSIMYL